MILRNYLTAAILLGANAGEANATTITGISQSRQAMQSIEAEINNQNAEINNIAEFLSKSFEDAKASQSAIQVQRKIALHTFVLQKQVQNHIANWDCDTNKLSAEMLNERVANERALRNDFEEMCNAAGVDCGSELAIFDTEITRLEKIALQFSGQANLAQCTATPVQLKLGEE